ncbi:MAG: ABC transporter permease [Aggregatilineales bacterium]
MLILVENVRIALVGLRANKLRSALTMLGITIGIAAVIVLVSVGQAVDTFVRSQFQGIGANLLFVFGAVDGFDRPRPLTQADLLAIADVYRVPEAEQVVPVLALGTRTVTSDTREVRVSTQGVTPAFAEVTNRTVVAGRFFDQRDLDGMSRVVVLGPAAAERLFPGLYPIGRTLRIQGVRFEVIGVLNSVGGGFGPPGTDRDSLVLMPLTTAQTRLSGERLVSGDRPISQILVRARDSSRVELAAQQIRQTLREVRGISFRDQDDFFVFTQSEILDSFGNVTGLLTIFLAIIAGISLLVGGIGIMNIMLVTVTERTREIGLRKAVGAQNRDILTQFLVEAVIIALLGGAVGLALAVGAAALAGWALPDLEVGVQVSSVLLATSICTLIGIFFGLYPASRAARLNPIDALRYE